MHAIKLPFNELARLEALKQYDVLNLPPAPAFDHIVELAVRFFNVPFAFIAFAGKDRQWMKACHGLSLRDMQQVHSLCTYTIMSSGATVEVEDLSRDERFQNHPFVITRPLARFYAGAPVRTPDGHNLGTLSVLDRSPRAFTKLQKDTLAKLAGLVMHELEGQYTHSRLNRQIAESEARCRNIVDNVREVIFQTDAGGVWTFLNPAWTELTGFPLEESIGRHFLHFVHPEDRRLQREQFRRLIEMELPACRHEIRYQCSDGGYCWVEIHARLNVSRYGDVPGITGTLIDITERKQIENTLALSESRFRAVFEQSGAGILLLMPGGRILSANPSAEEMFGFSEREMRHKAAFEIVHPDCATEMDAMIRQLASGERDRAHGKQRCVRKDGASFAVSMKMKLIRDENALPLFLVALVKNLSKRPHMETPSIGAGKDERSTVSFGYCHDLS